MKDTGKVLMSIVVCIFLIIIAVSIGSVNIPLNQIAKIILSQISGKELLDIDGNLVSIIWKIRFPRVLLAFVVGGALAVSGAVMQSVLKNPFASSYTLGVSSGASLGAGLIIISGFTIPLLGKLTLPFVGLLGGLLTVYLAINFTDRKSVV